VLLKINTCKVPLILHRVVTRPDVHGCVRRTSGRVRRSHRRPPADGKAVGRRGPTALRLPEGVAVRRPPGPSSKAVRRRWTASPFAGGRPQLPSTRSRSPPPSIWGRPPTPSALYDSNFSFLHYVFASLIAVTLSDSILEKLVENSL
jgi:hypothetical protein